MAPRTANITSTEAVRSLQVALQQFAADVSDALVMFDLECRRPLDWIENDRGRYWPRAVQQASDAVGEARIALERCELSIDANDRRSCYDEKKLLEKAKRRLRTAEEKVQVVKLWRGKLRKEIEEFLVQTAKLKQFLDADLLQAVAELKRMSEALDRYVQQGSASGSGPATAGIPSPGVVPPAVDPRGGHAPGGKTSEVKAADHHAGGNRHEGL